MNLSRVVVIVAVTAALVYFGLNMLLPQGKGANKAATATTADEVFAAAPTGDSGSTEAAAAATGDTAAAPAEAPAETPVETTTETTTETPAEPAPEVAGTAPATTEAGTSASLTDEQARQIASDVAERVVSGETIPQESAPAAVTAAAEPDGLTPEEARRIAENVSREVAARVESGGSVPAAAPASPNPTQTQYSAAAETTAETSQVAAAEPAPKASRPSARSKSASATSTRSSAVRNAARKPSPNAKVIPGSDSVSSWWRGPGEQSSGRLNLVYAGEAASEKAVVLMFDNAIGDAAAAGSKIRLLDIRGAAPSGSWELGAANPRMMLFKGVAPGRYTVIVNSGLSDASGKTLGSNLFGPVYVH